MLWNVKPLEGYLNKLESQVPPNYDVFALGLEHQGLDEVIRPNWEGLHSLEQDFIFSWFIEYQTVQETKNNLLKEVEEFNQGITAIQRNSGSKIDGLSGELKKITAEVGNLKNELVQKTQLAEDLTNAIRNKKLGVEELKQNLGKRIIDMKNRVLEHQKQFEVDQTKLGSQFEARVIKLDEEKLLLNDTFEKNYHSIEQLEKENQELKKLNRFLKSLPEKINQLQQVIAEIPPELLKGGGD
jgi:chromosome segregation ATPase